MLKTTMTALMLLTIAVPSWSQEADNETVAVTSATVLAPVALAADHEYKDPVLESQAWVVMPATEEGAEPTLVPIDEISVVPGHRVLYEMAVINPTDAMLNDIVLSSAFPQELRLQDLTLQGPEGMQVAYSVVEDPEVFYPVFPMPAQDVWDKQPSTDLISVFRVTVPEVPAESKVLVTYAAEVRLNQTVQPTIDETQEEN